MDLWVDCMAGGQPALAARVRESAGADALRPKVAPGKMALQAARGGKRLGGIRAQVMRVGSPA